MPFDANLIQPDDNWAKGLTMAFMLMLSKQPHMLLEFDTKEFVEFPYECFTLSAAQDPSTGNYTFMLVSNDDCEKTH